ncbi:conserved exported protein of unknown function [Rhodovastum atsumiense]|uniref:DUF3035 domain-containing protein n=1 Tax=Rhodovastum atsumiense TaxID=504468 RepID=A0A5M6IVB9_9PROT|nr:DUF3035 domain-containing protein [Rhodovastum atsumiense]KAA5611498.1 DUF3035 domain-containing protein [Rhodovastum atsumiense]CAH2601194.1 conserved exported protein of unknown function [Rhodovastum atsumiense]
MSLLRILFAAALLPLALAGCGGDDISRSFGLTRDAPDEFQVTTRAPLSMPPDFSLRPPRPGAARPQEMTSRQAAEAALAPQAVLQDNQPAGGMSAGQQAFVAAAGPAAPADIRRKLDADAAREQTDRGFADKLMFWRSPRDKAVVVDPQKEAQRLRENAALGHDATSGDTPIIQRKNDTLWDAIF